MECLEPVMLARFEELIERMGELTNRRRGWPRSWRLARRVGGSFVGVRESASFFGLRHRVRPWQAVPALLAVLALIVGGFWLGSMVGGHASAATLIRTLTGKVITKNGIRYVKTSATTVKVNGTTIRIPPGTVALAASTIISGRTVAVPITKTVPVTIVTTVNDTATTTVVETLPVTGPTTTVQGPTQTVTDTVTITLPGTTVTAPPAS